MIVASIMVGGKRTGPRGDPQPSEGCRKPFHLQPEIMYIIRYWCMYMLMVPYIPSYI